MFIPENRYRFFPIPDPDPGSRDQKSTRSGSATLFIYCYYSVCAGGDGYGMRALPPFLLQQELRPLQHGALRHRHCLPRYEYIMPLAAESE